jgi:hypothetical protein
LNYVASARSWTQSRGTPTATVDSPPRTIRLGCGRRAGACERKSFVAFRLLYATSTDHISAFTINQSTGAPGTPLTMTGRNQNLGMVVSATLGHLYVSDFLNDAVDGFAINSSSGGLTPVSGSPFPAGAQPPVRAVSRMSSPVTPIYMSRISMPVQLPGLRSTRPAGSLHRFPALPFPQATLRCKRREITSASSCM